MNNSTQILTASLQRIAREEKDDKDTRFQYGTVVPSLLIARDMQVPNGADSFLEARRVYQQSTRDVSIGSY